MLSPDAGGVDRAESPKGVVSIVCLLRFNYCALPNLDTVTQVFEESRRVWKQTVSGSVWHSENRKASTRARQGASVHCGGSRTNRDARLACLDAVSDERTLGGHRATRPHLRSAPFALPLLHTAHTPEGGNDLPRRLYVQPLAATLSPRPRAGYDYTLRHTHSLRCPADLRLRAYAYHRVVWGGLRGKAKRLSRTETSMMPPD